jgi:hypothetical protein
MKVTRYNLADNDRKRKREVSLWHEGRAFDLWSLVHFLGGGVLAAAYFLLGFPFLSSFIASFVLLFLWELFEILKGIKESVGNIVMDMFMGAIGFYAIWYLMDANLGDNILLFLMVLGIFIALNIRGFVAYTKRAK